MPRQIPKKGFSASAAARSASTNPARRRASIASPKAPTPGRTTPSAARTSSGRSVIRASSPAIVQAWRTLYRLPIL